MAVKPAVIEAQLETAKAEREAIEGRLDGMEPKKHPKWREANARCTQIEHRLEKANQRIGTDAAEADSADESGSDDE